MKAAILILYLAGIVPLGIGLTTAGSSAAASNGTLLDLVGALLLIAAAVLALVKTAQTGRWGWFLAVLVFSGVSIPLYALFGPTQRPRPQQAATAHARGRSDLTPGDIAADITGGLLSGIWEAIKVMIRAIFS